MIREILRRPVSVIVATIALAALGAFALLKLPLSLLPQIERPSLMIVAKAASSSRDEMLHDVTTPIERRLASVAGVTSIESETRDGQARITIGSAWQTDPDRLRIDVARRIEGAAAAPLDDLSVETVTDVVPVIEVAVLGASGGTRSRIADRVVLPELARIDGAGKIDVVGATPLRATVRPRDADLIARGLSAADVEQRLRAVGRSVAAGRLREGAAVRPVVVAEPVRSVDELRRIAIGTVPLGEIADVELREVGDDSTFRVLDPSTGAARDGVLLRVYRAPNANAVALARGVRRRVAELGGRLRDVQLRTVADRSSDVTRALAELALAAILGVLLGTIVLRWMIGHWRPTLALSVVIPAALLASFTAFYAAGVPLDVISIAGLALATGLLVDNSIVVLESIETARAAGARDSVLTGTRQIVVAVVASSITLMIVFAPLLYLRGLARAIFGEQALAVVVCIAASLLLALTLTPVLSRGGQPSSAGRTPGLPAYLALLDRAAANPARALTIGIAVVIAGLAVGLLLRRELFARGSERHIAVEVRTPADLDPTIARARLTQAWNASRTEIRPVSMALTQVSLDKPATIDIEMPSSRAANRAVDEIRSRVASLDGMRADVRLRPSVFIEAVGGDAARVEMIVSAATDREAESLAARTVDAMRQHGFRLAEDARSTDHSLALGLRWDERLLAANKIDRRTIESDVTAALGDFDAGRADIAAAEPDIRLLPTRPSDLALVPVHVSKTIVPLGAVSGARLMPRSAPAFHDERRPARRLIFEGSDIAAADSAIAVVVPRGTERIRVAGHARELRDAFGQMRLALVLAAILLYLTVAAFYESLLLPIPVIAALPFAAAGAMVALFITGQSLNIMSLLGLIFLGGVVVNHTVVLLDRAEHLRADGVHEDEAIRRAAADRYRPVIMTTLTAVLGMLPLALFGGPGVELRRSIAIAVIGGLTTATIGTLVLIPLLHRALEPMRRRSRQPREEPAGEVVHA